MHLTGSLKLLGASVKKNVQELITDLDILPKQDEKNPLEVNIISGFKLKEHNKFMYDIS